MSSSSTTIPMGLEKNTFDTLYSSRNNDDYYGWKVSKEHDTSISEWEVSKEDVASSLANEWTIEDDDTSRDQDSVDKEQGLSVDGWELEDNTTLDQWKVNRDQDTAHLPRIHRQHTVSLQRSSLSSTKEEPKPSNEKKTLRFWLIFVSLMVVAILTALDMTIISTSLPTIVEDLPVSSISPTWISSAFLLTTTAFQPLMGGLADIIGRRGALISAIIFFLIGSVIAALSKSMLIIVIGRGVQGVGGGGIQALVEIIISDLTTLRERGIYVGLISLVFAVASFTAPVLGGVFSSSNWRWIFWINLPIGGIALMQIILFLNVEAPITLTLRQKLQRTDLVANAFLLAGTVGLLVGTTEGGINYAWTNWKILLSVFGGLGGLFIFFALEFIPNRLSPDPVLPLQLLSNRTAAGCYLMTFFHGVICYGLIYILPIYFQAIKGATPLKSAIDLFAATAPGPFAAIVSGVLMAITGRYKLQLLFHWAMLVVGTVLVCQLGIDTPVWKWVLFQVIAGIPVGALFTLTLPPIQASLPVKEVAHATAAFAFFRSFGSVWGIAMGTNIFIATINKKLTTIPGLDSIGLRGITALGFATELKRLPIEVLAPTRIAYQDALRMSFIAFIPVAAAGLLVSFIVCELPLQDADSQIEKEVSLESGIEVEQTISITIDEVQVDRRRWSRAKSIRWSYF